MFLDDEHFSWKRAGAWAALAWVALILAMVVTSRQPMASSWMLIAAPLPVVFLAGMYERDTWWIRGSLVALIPLVPLAVLLGLFLAAWVGSGLLLLGVPLVIAGAAVALALAAGLGVWAGRTLTARGWIPA